MRGQSIAVWAINQPAVTAAETAQACAGSLRQKQDRLTLLAAVDHLSDNSERYQECGSSDQLHLTSDESYRVPGLTDEQMRSIYDRQLGRSASTGGGRVRSKIMSGAPHGRCSYCRYSPASTLDHFVPKSVVAGLSLEPWNLIPSCPRCNQQIASQWSADQEAQMLHPYFIADLGRWLYATVVREEPVAVRYYAAPPTGIDPQLVTRIHRQFARLRLGDVYSVTAGSDLAVVHHQLTDAALEAPADVSDHLMETARAEFAVDPNAQRGVLYEALAQDEWFVAKYIVA